MFFLRGALVSISVFVLVYAGASLVIGWLWRPLMRLARIWSERTSANTLYTLRMVPVILALFAAAGLAVPSFLRFEPHGGEEAIGFVPLLLGAAFLLLAGSGISRAWLALRHTARSVRHWISGAACEGESEAVFVNSPDAPPVALVGVGKSTLVISKAVQSMLTAAELERTIAHELAHRRASDNLKKLSLQACAFPGMARLEQAWRDAIELSADSEAVHSQAEALDLASALVKIARLHGGSALPELASGLVDGPQSSLELRVQRLVHWRAERSGGWSLRVVPISTLAFVALLAVNYSALLQSVHILTEFLVR